MVVIPTDTGFYTNLAKNDPPQRFTDLMNAFVVDAHLPENWGEILGEWDHKKSRKAGFGLWAESDSSATMWDMDELTLAKKGWIMANLIMGADPEEIPEIAKEEIPEHIRLWSLEGLAESYGIQDMTLEEIVEFYKTMPRPKPTPREITPLSQEEIIEFYRDSWGVELEGDEDEGEE